MERVAPVAGKRTRPVAAVLSVIAASALIAVACTVHANRGGATELLSPLQVGRYAVRAERQSKDYDSKAERQIAFATDSDNAATSERELAAKEEKRARESAYLAADVKSRIDKILEAGRDQVGKVRRTDNCSDDCRDGVAPMCTCELDPCSRWLGAHARVEFRHSAFLAQVWGLPLGIKILGGWGQPHSCDAQAGESRRVETILNDAGWCSEAWGHSPEEPGIVLA